MFILRIIIAIFFSTVFLNVIKGQGWPIIYGDNEQAHVRSILEDYDKGYMIAAYLDNGLIASQWGWIFKTNINGEIVWSKKLGSLLYRTFISNMHMNNDNSKIVSGAISKYDIVGKFDPFFMKINVCGEIEWCQVLQSPNTNYGIDITQLNDGSYIGLMKYYGGDYENVRISLVKMDSLGEPVWIKHLAQEDSLIYNEEGYYLIHTADDNCIVSGHCFYPNSRPFWIKTDLSGEQIWDLKWSVGSGSADQIIESNNGTFYVAGGIISSGRPMTPTIFKFDNNGNQLYHKFLLGDTIVGGGAKPLCFYNDSTLLTGFNWSNVPYPVDIGYSEIIMIDTVGNIKKRRLLLDENKPPTNNIKTYGDKILVSGNYFVDDNWDIYLWKLNSDLEDDTLYTQSFNYDSLCPYQITSDTIDLECGLHVAIEDIPLKEEYDKILKIWPNPAGEVVNCRLSIVGCRLSMSLEIYDIFGRKMEEVKISQGQDHLQINVSSYPAGLYVAVLRSDGKILGREKFVVVK